MNDYTAGKPWKVAKARCILEEGFRLFSERGIESVTIPEVAVASGVSRATVFRYFPSKLELVVAIATWKWDAYIQSHNATLSGEALEKLTGAEHLRFYLDSFLDLYRNHRDILRFNYNFNSYLRHALSSPAQKQPYLNMVDALGAQFHALYARGMEDGTLRADVRERTMFSSSFHIMLAAVTRYAVGLVVVYDDGDPESELIMLEELLLSRFTNPSLALRIAEDGARDL